MPATRGLPALTVWVVVAVVVLALVALPAVSVRADTTARRVALLRALWQDHPLQLRNVAGVDGHAPVTLTLSGTRVSFTCDVSGGGGAAGRRWPAAAGPALAPDFDGLRSTCSSFPAGFWQYVWCHEQYVHQVHVDDSGDHALVVSLGRFAATTPPDAHARTPRRDVFHDGERCDGDDSTGDGRPRSAAVTFQCCHPGVGVAAAVVAVDEPATCTYDVTVCALAACHAGADDGGGGSGGGGPPGDAVLPHLSIHQAVVPLLASCFTLSAGWWTYELCPGTALRQFHTEPLDDGSGGAVVTASHVLGVAAGADVAAGVRVTHATVGAWDFEQHVDVVAPQESHFVVTMTGGDVCDGVDVTRGAPGSATAAATAGSDLRRVTRVHLFCPPVGATDLDGAEWGDTAGASGHTPTQLVSVEEVRTCEYVAVLHTPLVCHFPGFTAPNHVVQPSCSPNGHGWAPPGVP